MSKKQQSDRLPVRTAVTRAEARTVRGNSRTIPALAPRKAKKKKAVKPRKGTKVELHVIPRSIHPGFEAWVRALHRPRDHRGTPCPVNENPAPSNVVLSTTVSWTSQAWVVDSQRTSQICLFAGRGPTGEGGISFDNCTTPAGTTAESEVGAGDEVAVHTRLIGTCPVGGTAPTAFYAVGPMPVAATFNVAGAATPYTLESVIGVISSGLQVNDALIAGTGTSWLGGGAATNAGKWYGMVPDVPIGLTANAELGHSRWKLTSCDISIRNTSPVQSRGGNIAICMPSNKFYHPGSVVNSAWQQATLERYRTFRFAMEDHGDEMYASWVPRPGELAFNHFSPDQASRATLPAAVAANADPFGDSTGVYVFLNNTTATSQSYTIEVVQNFDIAGQSVSQLGTTAEHAPQLMPAVQTGIAIATNGTAPIGHAMIMGAKAALTPIAGEVNKAATSALSNLARSLPKAAAAAAAGFLG